MGGRGRTYSPSSPPHSPLTIPEYKITQPIGCVILLVLSFFLSFFLSLSLSLSFSFFAFKLFPEYSHICRRAQRARLRSYYRTTVNKFNRSR